MNPTSIIQCRAAWARSTQSRKAAITKPKARTAILIAVSYANLRLTSRAEYCSQAVSAGSGKPFTDAKNTEKLYDIIGRIKKGMYPGADYVLFGAINSIEFRQEANPIDNTNTVSHTLSLELVGEFSLISTKNYTVKSSFSAMGAGQDVSLLTTQGGRVVLNRGKVVLEVPPSW